MRPISSVFMFGLLLVALCSTAPAQMFGGRQLGQPLQRQPGLSRFSRGGTGEVQGSERFLRQNRGRSQFVGADPREGQGFVGSEQGRTSGRVLSALAGMRPPPDRTRQINRPLAPPSAQEMYHPTLQVAFPTSFPTAGELGERLTAALSGSDRLSPLNRVVVSVVERTAILQGEVVSARERGLAELLVLFEPGISAVKNQLRIQSPMPPPPPVPPLPEKADSYPLPPARP